MKIFPSFRQSLVCAAIACLAVQSSAQAQIEPAALELLQATAQKLGAAKTIRVTAKHRIEPAASPGGNMERGPVTLTVQRPNQFHAVQNAGPETREIAYDGRTFVMIHPQLKHHAMEKLSAGSIEKFADTIDAKFGFRPPLAELLANDMATEMMRDVTSAKLMGSEWIGFTRCERLQFEQPGMTGDLWIGSKDKLPRRYRMTFTDIRGNPTWDIRLSKWELNLPVDEGLFSKRPAAGSQKLQMLKSR